MAKGTQPQTLSRTVNTANRVLTPSSAATTKPKLTPYEAWLEMMRKRMAAMNPLAGSQYDPNKNQNRLVRPATPPGTVANPALKRENADSSPTDQSLYSQDPYDEGIYEGVDTPKPEKPTSTPLSTAASSGLGGAVAEGVRQTVTGSAPAASSTAPGASALSTALGPPSTPNVIGGHAIASTVPTIAPHNYGALGLNSTVPGLAGTGLAAAGVAAGAATGARQMSGAINLAQGKKPSAIEHAALFPITGGLDVVARPFLGGMEAGKEARRDNLGTFMQNTGDLVNRSDYTVALPDGRRISIGGDTFRDENGNPIVGKTPDDKAYNLDWNDPRVSEAVALVDPLVVGGIGYDAKNREQMVAKLVNIALLTDDPSTTIRSFYDNAGIDRDTIYNRISTTIPKGGERNAMLATIDRIFGVQPNAGGGGSSGSRGGSGRSESNSAPAPLPAPVMPTVSVPESFGYQNPQPNPRPYDQTVSDIINVQAANQSTPMDLQTNPLSRALYRRRYG